MDEKTLEHLDRWIEYAIPFDDQSAVKENILRFADTDPEEFQFAVDHNWTWREILDRYALNPPKPLDIDSYLV